MKESIPVYTIARCGDESTVLMDGTPLTMNEVVQLLTANERLLAIKQAVLDAVPECPLHGKNCVPHAVEWVEKRKAEQCMENNTGNGTVKEWASAIMEYPPHNAGEISMIIDGKRVNMVSFITEINGEAVENKWYKPVEPDPTTLAQFMLCKGRLA